MLEPCARFCGSPDNGYGHQEEEELGCKCPGNDGTGACQALRRTGFKLVDHLIGEQTVEEALAGAQEMSEAYRACVITNDAFDDMEAQQTCADEAGLP